MSTDNVFSCSVSKWYYWCTGVANNNNSGQNVSLFNNLVCKRNGLPVNLLFPGDCVPGGRHTCIVIARFIGHHCERRWFHYSKSMTLCNQHLLHNDPLKHETCLLPVYVIREIKISAADMFLVQTHVLSCASYEQSFTL